MEEVHLHYCHDVRSNSPTESSHLTNATMVRLESGILIPVTLAIYLVFLIRLPDGGHAALAVLNLMLPQIMVSTVMLRVAMYISS